MTAIKEKPIIMQGESVRAILDDRKTQARWVIKLPPAPMRLGVWEPTTFGGKGGGRTSKGEEIAEQVAIWHTRTGKTIAAPYEVGQKLWVREAWHTHTNRNKYKPRDLPVNSKIYYSCEMPEKKTSYIGKYRNALFMPRWASRITLEVTAVRAENLVTLSYNDAIKEGFDSIKSFKAYWDKINKKRGFSWQSRPWVWIYEFKRSE